MTPYDLPSIFKDIYCWRDDRHSGWRWHEFSRERKLAEAKPGLISYGENSAWQMLDCFNLTA